MHIKGATAGIVHAINNLSIAAIGNGQASLPCILLFIPTGAARKAGQRGLRNETFGMLERP